MECRDCSELRETNPYARCERCAEKDEDYEEEE